MTSTLSRSALGAIAAAALAAALVACSSSPSDPPATPAPTTSQAAPQAGPTGPASPEDQAAMTEVFQRYLTTSNAGQSQPYLDTLCSSSPVHEQGLTDRDPNPYPMFLVGITDFAVDGDDGLATVTVKIGLEESADNITRPFTFVREHGAWTVCGEPQN